jgi:hypothetical protein
MLNQDSSNLINIYQNLSVPSIGKSELQANFSLYFQSSEPFTFDFKPKDHLFSILAHNLTLKGSFKQISSDHIMNFTSTLPYFEYEYNFNKYDEDKGMQLRNNGFYSSI